MGLLGLSQTIRGKTRTEGLRSESSKLSIGVMDGQTKDRQVLPGTTYLTQDCKDLQLRDWDYIVDKYDQLNDEIQNLLWTVKGDLRAA